MLDDALDAGIADVLLLPQLTDSLVFALRKAGHAGRRAARDGQSGPGRIVTVFSPKGGTGKTVVSTNLCAAFAKYLGLRALLFDLDLAPGELDSEKLAGYTTKHVSGLDILPAPLRPEDAELVTEAKLGSLLEVARESYDCIVV